VTGNHDFQAAGFDMKKVELFHRRADGTAADLLDNSYAVIGIDDLVANMEIQVAITHI
jgi:hypothetical protein